MAKKIGIRLLFLVLLFFVLEMFYHITFLERDMGNFAKESLEIKSTQNKTDIYYFGESSNVTYGQDDSTKESISILCNKFFPTLRITNINKYATHGGIYKEWLTQLNLENKKPEAVVVTLNLRSFDAAWIHSTLENALQQSVMMSKPYPKLLNRFLLSLQAFENKTPEQREQAMLNDWKTKELIFNSPFKYRTVREWDDAMANGGHVLPNGEWDNKKIELACHYIKAYAFNINNENPRIKDFDEIVNWCKLQNIRLYLNLLAENIAYADSLVGKELVFLMRQNRNYLKQRYNHDNCVVVDNLESIRGNWFIDQNWTTEHYNDKGRMIIAKTLAESLKEQFKESYIKAY